MQSHFVQVEGARIHYATAGSGTPVVLIHGMMGSTLNWSSNADFLARTHRVYALDLPNMGESDRTPGLGCGLAVTAGRIAAWMRTVGIRRADIVGHSHGGTLAMVLAAEQRELVRSLLLFAPANPWSRSADRILWFYNHTPGRQLARLTPYLPERLQLYGLGRMCGDPRRATPELLEGYIRGLRIPGTILHILDVVRTWHEQMRALPPMLPALAAVPTLLVWGDRDRAVSLASGVRLQQALTGSEFVVIPGAGHLPFQEFPAECNQLMAKWLDRMTAEG